MVTVRGQADVKRYMSSVRATVPRILPGAARAAAKVIAEEARHQTASAAVRDSIKVRVSRKDGRVIAHIETRGPGAYLAPWEEYGTAPHFISVDDQQRAGRSVEHINRLTKAEPETLVIAGYFVGKTVHHPGARAHPFLRPALDFKHAEAIDAARAYIAKRITPFGISGADEPGGDE